MYTYAILAPSKATQTTNTPEGDTTMKKQYYVHYYKDFANTYNLYWSYEALNYEGYERITRKQAEALAAEENSRRKHDPGFSGHADNTIKPYCYDNYDIVNDRRMFLNGYVWDYVKLDDYKKDQVTYEQHMKELWV